MWPNCTYSCWVLPKWYLIMIKSAFVCMCSSPHHTCFLSTSCFSFYMCISPSPFWAGLNTMTCLQFSLKLQPDNVSKFGSPLQLPRWCMLLDNGSTGYNSGGSSCSTLLGSDFYIFVVLAGMWQCVMSWILLTLFQEHQHQWPTLFKLAMDLLPAQATSVPREHVFSASKETNHSQEEPPQTKNHEGNTNTQVPCKK